MSNDMNFEFELKKRFSEEAQELPESLKKENVIKMLENNSVNSEPVKKKRIFPKVLSVAAALAITLAAVYVMPLVIPEKGLVEATTVTEASQQETTENYKVIETDSKGKKLLQAESNDDIRKHFVKALRAERIEGAVDDAIDAVGNAAEGAFDYVAGNKSDDAVYEYYYDAVDSEEKAEVPAVTMAATTQAPMQAPALTTQVVGSVETTVASAQGTDDNRNESYVAYDESHEETVEENYGKTNTQVENVDEADIIKNDGKYLYILSGGIYSADTRVTIVDTDSMEIASKLELEYENYSYYIREMYVNGDRLILLASEGEKLEDNDVTYRYHYYYQGKKVVSFVYDISDRQNPTFVRKVSQDGFDYISSRMIDGVLYTVSSYWVSGEKEEEIKENAIPHVNGKEISCDCIYIYDYDSTDYIVISAYDTKKSESEVGTLSILGSGEEVYCSKDALYIASTNYGDNDVINTDIYSFSIDKEKIAYKATGSIKGSFLNQFSFDEYNNNLRVATTYYSYKHDVDVSNVYVLDKNLKLIGALEDIAYDEQVKSVRFMGDTGYIVTFRNTDPLFTLDLSDPTAPKVIGEVKLPGFSSYLHPVGDGLVVGIGYDGDEDNADFSSLKVSLFDVSDMRNPKEVDTFVLKNVDSDVLYNPKAFIYYPEENLIGFPVRHYDDATVLSYKLLRIENGKISSHLGFVHESERDSGEIFRGTYIGNKLYTVDNYNVCEFAIDTADLLRKCEILSVEDDKLVNGGYYYEGVEVSPPMFIDDALIDSEATTQVTTTVGIVQEFTTESVQ